MESRTKYLSLSFCHTAKPGNKIEPNVNEEAGHQLKTPLKIELRSNILLQKNINYLEVRITEQKCR